MTSRFRKALAAAGFLGLAGPAAAQSGAPAAGTGFSITPYIGVVIPTADLMDYNNQVTKLSTAITFGGRLGIGLGARFGIEGDVGYSPASLEFSSTGVTANQDVKILTGSAKASLYLIPRTSPFWIGLSGGMAAVRHSFKAASGGGTVPDAGTNVGGVIGASAGIRIGRLVAFNVGVEDYLYSASYDVSGTKTSEKKQHDIRITGGVRVPFVGF